MSKKVLILSGSPRKGGNSDILCDQLDLDREQVTQDSEIIDDLGADSLDIVDLIMTLEDEFDTEITDEMIEGMRTVGDIAKFVEEHC